MQNSKKWSNLLWFVLFAATTANGQCLYDDPFPGNGQMNGGAQGGQLYESQNGEYIYPHGTLRALVILVELDYADPTDDPAPTGTQNWPLHALPDWLNKPVPDQNLFDCNVPTGTATGLMTRYFQVPHPGNLMWWPIT